MLATPRFVEKQPRRRRCPRPRRVRVRVRLRVRHARELRAERSRRAARAAAAHHRIDRAHLRRAAHRSLADAALRARGRAAPPPPSRHRRADHSDPRRPHPRPPDREDVTKRPSPRRPPRPPTPPSRLPAGPRRRSPRRRRTARPTHHADRCRARRPRRTAPTRRPGTPTDWRDQATEAATRSSKRAPRPTGARPRSAARRARHRVGVNPQVASITWTLLNVPEDGAAVVAKTQHGNPREAHPAGHHRHRLRGVPDVGATYTEADGTGPYLAYSGGIGVATMTLERLELRRT